MIYVNQKQLDQVEYILEQSSQGFHVLFDTDDIRRVFLHRKFELSTKTYEQLSKHSKKNDNPATKGQPTEAEKHIENLILQPTILSKKTYLENLTSDMYDEVLCTYFSIVENNIFEGMEYSH